MSYALPLSPGLRIPRFLRRSAAQRPLASPAQSVTPAATATSGSAMAPVAPWRPSGLPALRDAEAFRAAIFALVETEMSKLTDARAVDEWHRQVLDPRIAAEVEQEVRLIEMVARQRQTALAGDQLAVGAEVAQVARLESETDAALEQARQAVRVARARLDAIRSGTPVDVRDSVVGQNSEAELAVIRAELDSHHAAIARALKSLKADSEQQLAFAALAAEQEVADFDRRIVQQERIVASAEAEVKAAHDRFSGADPIAAPETIAGADVTPEPTGAPPNRRRTSLAESQGE